MDQLELPFVLEATALRRTHSHSSAGTTAAVVPFPAHRDARLVARLAVEFISLRERHGRRCRALLLSKRFKPIGARLRRIGVSDPVAARELAELERAVAREVWIHDGRPSLGSGGGSAA